jgi:hypothetical protein
VEVFCCVYLDTGDVFVIFIISKYFDSGIYTRAYDKHRHGKNTVSSFVLPRVPIVVIFTFSRDTHAYLKRKEKFKFTSLIRYK